MPTFKLPVCSAPLYKTEKRADESIAYTIDLTTELDNDEIIIAVQSPKYVAPITQYRSRRGKYLEVTIPDIVLEGAASTQESKCVIKYATNKGCNRTAAFIVKVYR